MPALPRRHCLPCSGLLGLAEMGLLTVPKSHPPWRQVGTCPRLRGGQWAQGQGRGEASSHAKWGKSPSRPCLGDPCDSCRQGVNLQADGASITAAIMAPSTLHDNICSQKVAVLRATALRLQTSPSLTGYKYGRRKNQHSLLVLRQS